MFCAKGQKGGQKLCNHVANSRFLLGELFRKPNRGCLGTFLLLWNVTAHHRQHKTPPVHTTVSSYIHFAVGQRVDRVRRHTLLSVRMNEWSDITTPPAGLRGEHWDNRTCAASTEQRRE